MTPDQKQQIDAMDYQEMLRLWRFAYAGSPWFQGDTGAYFSQRMKKLRDAGADHVAASKALGWEPS